MPIRHIALAVAGVAVLSAGCDDAAIPVTPTRDDQTVISDVLTGTVPAPVHEVFQSTFRTYVVGQGGGAVSVTLTSAVQTRPDGSLHTTVTMGLGAGTVVNGACVVPVNSSTSTPAGPNPQLAGSQSEGTYCIKVSDVTGQVGPVAFSVTVKHP